MTRIAVVDDEIAILTSLRSALEAEGYDVEVYADAAVALPKLISVPPNLVILNGWMPGVNGIDFFLMFRKFAKVPVIFLSADADKIALSLRSISSPASAYMEKPFSQRALVDLVAATLTADPALAVREARRRKKERRLRRFERLRERFFGTCFYCDCPLLVPGEGPRKSPRMTTRDHLIPRSQGGGRNVDNIVAACHGCNNRRGDMPWLVFFATVDKRSSENR